MFSLALCREIVNSLNWGNFTNKQFLKDNPLFDDSELLKSFLQVIGIVPFPKELSAKISNKNMKASWRRIEVLQFHFC